MSSDLKETALNFIKECNELREDLKYIEIEENKKLETIKRIGNYTDNYQTVICLLQILNKDLFVGKNEISKEQLKDILLILTPEQLNLMENYSSEIPPLVDA
jgi:hypothetical protein